MLRLPFIISGQIRGSVLRNAFRTLSDVAQEPTKLSGFAEAYEKHGQKPEEPKKESLPFATLLRNSKFIDVRI